MISASQANFELEELAGIDSGVKKKGLYNEQSMIEKLMDAYDRVQELYSHKIPGFGVNIHPEKILEVEKELTKLLTVEYSANDISDFVEYVNMKDWDEDGSIRIGAYVGSLISLLTEKNKKLGKRTIIEIPENHLDYLGNHCRKFDVVKIGVNYGEGVFRTACSGKLLYVERNEGDNFASWARFVDIIAAGITNGGYFACNAGADRGFIDIIAAKEVNGENFAQGAGTENGHVNAICKGKKKVFDDYFKFNFHDARFGSYENAMYAKNKVYRAYEGMHTVKKELAKYKIKWGKLL
jgi:hypothetical protein